MEVASRATSISTRIPPRNQIRTGNASTTSLGARASPSFLPFTSFACPKKSPRAKKCTSRIRSNIPPPFISRGPFYNHSASPHIIEKKLFDSASALPFTDKSKFVISASVRQCEDSIQRCIAPLDELNSMVWSAARSDDDFLRVTRLRMESFYPQTVPNSNAVNSSSGSNNAEEGRKEEQQKRSLREEIQRRHYQERVDEEFLNIRSKVLGLFNEGEWSGRKVVCLLGKVRLAETVYDCRAGISEEFIHLSPPHIAASLDINLGIRLPGEPLMGKHTRAHDAINTVAYLSNVCVHPSLQRMGVGKRMGEEAKRRAKEELGIRHLYVHVVSSNLAAVQLYLSLGFIKEQEETRERARIMARPARMLMHLELV